MKRVVIGFGHKRLRGKDTAAEFAIVHMKERYGPTRQDFFAYSLKEGVGKGVFGLTHEQLYNQDRKVEVDEFWEETPRNILQRAGTEALREKFGSDIWVNTVRRRLLLDNTTHAVISDMRFPNEAEAVRSWGGVTVRIDRHIPFTPGVDDHSSETSLDGWSDWDYVIDNNGTLKEFYSKVQDVIDEIFKKVM